MYLQETPSSATVCQVLAYLMDIPEQEENFCAMERFHIPKERYTLISRRGYFGVEKTLQKLRETLLAKRVRERVKRFIRHCLCC